jgi:hypothetical protein
LTTEAVLRHLRDLIHRHARGPGHCGRQRVSLALMRTGLLRLGHLAGPPRRGGGGRGCGLLGDRVGDGVWEVKVNVHDLGKVGASSAGRRVTVYCRRNNDRCVTLTRYDGTKVWAGRFVLRLKADPTAVRRIARAMRRALWFAKNDWRYTRPSSQALRYDLRSSGRRLRNWGIGLIVPGILATGTGAVLVAYSLSCTSGGLTCLGHALIGALGAMFLIPGAIVTAVGIPLIFVGVGKISDAGRPDHQLDYEAPRPVVSPEGTRPQNERRWIFRQQRWKLDPPNFMMNLRFRF